MDSLSQRKSPLGSQGQASPKSFINSQKDRSPTNLQQQSEGRQSPNFEQGEQYSPKQQKQNIDEYNEYKKKLQKLEAQKINPQDKDNYIQLLVQRLQANEQAIEAAQKVVIQQKMARKKVTKALKAKTQELREKVKQASRPVKDRVKDQLERRLNEIVEEKIEIQDELQRVEKEHKLKIQFLQQGEYGTYQFFTCIRQKQKQLQQLKDTEKETRQKIANSSDKMQQVQTQLKTIEQQIDQNLAENTQRKGKLQQAKMRLDSAVTVVQKLQGSTSAMQNELRSHSILSGDQKQKYLNSDVQQIRPPTPAQPKKATTDQQKRQGKVGFQQGRATIIGEDQDNRNDFQRALSKQNMRNSKQYKAMQPRKKTPAHPVQDHDDQFWYKNPGLQQ